MWSLGSVLAVPLFAPLSNLLSGALAFSTAPAAEGAPPLGALLPIWTVLPFLALLLSIAILPLAAPHWWAHNRNKAIVAAALAVPFAAYLGLVHGAHGRQELLPATHDYLSFIALLASLFIISGGIHTKGS